MAILLPPPPIVALRVRPRRWVTALALGICIVTVIYTLLMVWDWLRGVGWGKVYGPIHQLVFGCDALILAAALRHMRHQSRPYRWACAALLLGNLLTILSSLADAPAYHSGAEAAIQPAQLVLYILIYVCANGGLALLVPPSLPRLLLLRLGVDTLLAMTFSNMVLETVLPLVMPGWEWTQTLTAAKARFVAGTGMVCWYLLAYRRVALFRDPLVRVWGLGLMGMLASDTALLWATYATTHGAPPTTLNIVMPPWMAQQTLWAYGLYRAGRLQFRWRHEVPAPEVAHGRFALLLSLRHSLVILFLTGLLITQTLMGLTLPISGVLWLTSALLSREALWQHEFRYAVQLLQKAQAELKQSRDALEAFVRKVLHDLRSPLQFLHTVRTELGLGQLGQVLHMQTRRMERLMASLQHYIAKGQQPLFIAPVDIVSLAIEAVMLVQYEAEQRGIAVTLSAPILTALARADENAVRRILDNLLSNALRATSPGGTIVIGVEMVADDPLGVLLSVQDTGCGIAPEQRATIFQPQVGSFTGGTGLGLAIVSDLCEAMGARCLVTSEVGVGSRFEIQLPRCREDAPATEPQGGE